MKYSHEKFIYAFLRHNRNIIENTEDVEETIKKLICDIGNRCYKIYKDRRSEALFMRDAVKIIVKELNYDPEYDLRFVVVKKTLANKDTK